MNLKCRQIVLVASLVGLALAVWASPAQADFIRARDALAQAGTESALGRVELPELAQDAAQAGPVAPLPAPQPQDDDQGPLVRPNYLRPSPGHQAGMSAPTASAGASSSAPSSAILPAAVEPPCAGLSARLPSEMGISFSPPPPATPLRPPRG